MKILLKKGLIVDPVNNLHDKLDLLLEDNKIVKIAGSINEKKCDIIELDGKVILPGLIDMHTHLREPGYEEKETIITGCEAAAAGGFTTIACMANTDPVVDNKATVEYIKSRAKEGIVNVIPVGSITRNMEGDNLAEIGFMAESGVRAISDDGKPVMNSEIMRRAMEYAGSFGVTIIDHCEDLNLVGEGVMNEGYYSTILGLKPIPPAAEAVMIARDIILAELTGARLHIAHLSTGRGAELIRQAKKDKLPVTAEVTPHHLFLTDKEVSKYNPHTKVNPPLRGEKDVADINKALKEGIVDVIATDHAPHTYEDKLGEYDTAANGISGLETALSLIYENLVKPGTINWGKLVELMVINPAQILGIKNRGIKEGLKPDLTIFDPEAEWQVDPSQFKSKGKNTPFAGRHLQGKPLLTFVNGDIVYDDRGGKNEVIY